MIKESYTKNISLNKEICFLILGHEINQETFELSDSGKGRCELLSKLISNQENDNFFVIFSLVYNFIHGSEQILFKSLSFTIKIISFWC